MIIFNKILAKRVDFDKKRRKEKRRAAQKEKKEKVKLLFYTWYSK